MTASPSSPVVALLCPYCGGPVEPGWCHAYGAALSACLVIPRDLVLIAHKGGLHRG